ncbi:hypothetical protein [Nocardia sp. NPDC048505]|uniref:hypothetical protein n=1 Tax=unclassified Nocardia TaxID=2637762 RepID=UPI0033FB2292
MSKRLWVVAAVLVAALVTTGCGSTKHKSASSTTTSRVSTSKATTPKSTAPPAPLLNRRGAHGSIVQQNGLNGRGTLRIENGNSADFAVVVTNRDPKTPQATIYVHGNSEATLDGIAGTYYVYLKTGTDWDQATLNFTRARQFQKFDDPFDANSSWEITLQPSVAGNASTSDVPAF